MSFDRAGVDHPSRDADAPQLSRPLSTYLRLPLASTPNGPNPRPKSRRIQQCVTLSLAPNVRWRGFPRACALAPAFKPAFLRGELVTSASLLSSAPHHPLPRPSPCVVSLTMCLRPILVPLPLRQFPAHCINSPASSLQRPPHAMCPRLHRYTAHLKHEQRASFFRLYILYLY